MRRPADPARRRVHRTSGSPGPRPGAGPRRRRSSRSTSTRDARPPGVELAARLASAALVWPRGRSRCRRSSAASSRGRASRPPNAGRSATYLHGHLVGTGAAPSHRMTWVIRAGPSRTWAYLNPSSTPPSTSSSATNTSVNRISQWPPSIDRSTVSMCRTDLDAGRAARSEEHRGASRLARLPAGAGHDDVERGAVRTGDEPLVAVDQPPSVDLRGRGRQHRRIGAGARRRLGHGERRPGLARSRAAPGSARVALPTPRGRAGGRFPRPGR